MKKKLLLIILFLGLFLSMKNFKVSALENSNIDGTLNSNLVYEIIPYNVSVSFNTELYGTITSTYSSKTMSTDLLSLLNSNVSLPEYEEKLNNFVYSSNGVVSLKETYNMNLIYKSEFMQYYKCYKFFPIGFPEDTNVKIIMEYKNVDISGVGDSQLTQFVIANESDYSTSQNYFATSNLKSNYSVDVEAVTGDGTIITRQYTMPSVSVNPLNDIVEDGSIYQNIKITYNLAVKQNVYDGLCIIQYTDFTTTPNFIEDFNVEVVEQEVEIDNWIIEIFKTFDSFLAIKFGNVTIGSILLIPVILSIVFVILKTWRGGSA